MGNNIDGDCLNYYLTVLNKYAYVAMWHANKNSMMIIIRETPTFAIFTLISDMSFVIGRMAIYASWGRIMCKSIGTLSQLET